MFPFHIIKNIYSARASRELPRNQSYCVCEIYEAVVFARLTATITAAATAFGSGGGVMSQACKATRGC